MFGVFTFTLTNFIAKILFSRGYRGCTKEEVEIPEGLWGIILVVKLWNSGEWRGGGEGVRDYAKFPPWWGVDIFGTTQLRLHNKDHLSKVTVNHKT